MKLVCLGDSLTYGYGVKPSCRWTTLASQEMGWDIYNHGITGDTTGGMLARLQSRIVPQLQQDGVKPQDVVVLIVGGSNDIFFSGTDLNARANIAAIVHQVFNMGMTPVVGTPLPADADSVLPAWRQAGDFDKVPGCIEAYVKWLRSFCLAFGVPFIDFSRDFTAKDGTAISSMYIDGLHPTAEGHRLMANRLVAKLKELAR